MQLSGGLRERIQQRKAGGIGLSVTKSMTREEQFAQDKKSREKAKEADFKAAHAGRTPEQEAKFQAYYKELFKLEDADAEFNKLKSLIPTYQTFAAGYPEYRRALPIALNRIKELNLEHQRKARAYVDGQFPVLSSGGLNGLGEINPQTGTPYITGGGQTIFVPAGTCIAMGGTLGGLYSAGANSGYGPLSPDIYTCYLQPPPPAPVQRPAPASIRVNVNPAIQTQVSPQVSPVFQQAFQPSNSPMAAGTTQNMPTSQSAAPAPPAPQYTPPPAPAPTAAPDQSAALLAQQQKMYEALINKLTAPGGALTAPQPSPAPAAPPAPMNYAAPLPIAGAPQPFDTSMLPVSGDVTSTLPQVGLSTGGQTAAAAFAAQNPSTPQANVSTAVIAPAKSNLPLIFALLAGAGILFVGMSQHKGKRHAA